MKITIIGTGGVGGYFGAMLARAGEAVVFVARGEHGTQMRERGLTVKSVDGDFVVQPVQVVQRVSGLRDPELVLFTVKTYDTQQVAIELVQVANSNKTHIITFQNGVDNDMEIKKFIPNANVYPGVCYVISARTGPGLIEQTGGMRSLVFGDRNHTENIFLKEVEAMMQKAGINAKYSVDIMSDVWKKFIFILAFSGMTAYKQQPIGEILSNSDSLKEYETVLKEAETVARALGVNLPDDIVDATIAAAQRTAPNSKSSLLVDIEHKRRTEIESLNGKLVRLAASLGIPVPMNETIYKTVMRVTQI